MLDRKAVRELWMKDTIEHRELLEGRAKDSIEKHRKGWCKLRFVDELGNPIKGKKVKVNQQAHDFKYGANIFMLDEFGDDVLNAKFRENFKKYFNLATVPFFWGDLEPEQGKPRFDKNSPKIYRRPAPELCLEYCEENGIEAKLHCLVYDKFTPDWLPKKDMAAMEKAYEERTRQIAERYAGRLYEVEVINELTQESKWTTQSVICDKHDVVEWAFDLARKYFPNDTLLFNDANYLAAIGVEDFRHPYYMLLENSILKGADIDKIGVQHHDFRGSRAKTQEQYEEMVMKGSLLFNPKNLFKGLDTLETLGLPLEITEITIPTFGFTEEDEELQADLLEMFYTVCFSHPAVETIIYWNVPDGYAFVEPDASRDENNCKGGLWRHDLTPKKSCERLWELFNKRWHTDLELTTDENGYVEFRGFYGDYTAEIDDCAADFGIHKGFDNCTEIELG